VKLSDIVLTDTRLFAKSTTRLYDRRRDDDEVSLNEVERIMI
jgi:hypothetical protein